MQKVLFALALFCFMPFILITPAFAATLIDDMDSADNNETKTYQNLAPAAIGTGNRDKLPDRTFITFANPVNPIGAVTYRVSGAERITLNIYTQTGTFASEITGMPGVYALGVYNEATAAAVPGGAVRALYSTSRRLAYIIVSGKPYRLCYSNSFNICVFEPDSADSPGDLISYGVNLWVSSDGQNYRRATLAASGMSYIKDCFLCYEEFTGNIPPDAAYIRVELNDMTSIPHENGQGSQSKSASLMTGLAKVKIDGTYLAVGEPAPPKQESEPPANSSSSSSKPSSSVKSSSTKAAGTSSTSSSQKSSSEAVKKFEGEITNSSAITSSSGKASSSHKSSGEPQRSPDSSRSETSVAAPANDFSQTQPIIHRVEAKGKNTDGMLNSAVIIYIFIVAGFALLAVILKLKK